MNTITLYGLLKYVLKMLFYMSLGLESKISILTR